MSKAIDKSVGIWRGKAGAERSGNGSMAGPNYERTPKGDPATAAAAAAGWGTDLKPAIEPIVLARKPFKGTVAANVQRHGTAAINIAGCRIPYEDSEDKAAAAAAAAQRLNHDQPGAVYKGCGKTGFTDPRGSIAPYLASMDPGRWPANLIAAPGILGADTRYVDLGAWFAAQENGWHSLDAFTRGALSGLWPCPKPDASEKDAGLAEFAKRRKSTTRDDASWEAGSKNPRAVGGSTERRNIHPTVKPVALMRWLVRLVTPPGGRVLEPFAGSGTTLVAAVHEGCGYLGIDREAEYVEIAKARAAHAEGEAASMFAAGPAAEVAEPSVKQGGLFDGPARP